MDQYINELETNGYTIIPNVLTDNECENYSNDMWKTLEYLTNDEIKKDDTSTYKNIYKLYPLHSMLIQHYSIGHAQFIWDLRQDQRIINIFSEFYKYFLPDESYDKLLVSFDGLSQHMAPEITKRGWLQMNSNGTPRYPWYHSDQSFTKTFNNKKKANEFSCIQSWITFNDVMLKDATLSVIKGSHKKELRDEFKIKFNPDNSEWHKLNKDELNFYINNGLEIIDIVCKKGSMVLWDSRLIHCGKEPIKNRTQSNIRQVVYLSYQPKSLCSSANLRKRTKAFDEMRMTGHSAAFPKLFAKDPRTYGNELYKVQILPKPILNELGLSLI